ncbi:predicted protein, partial [Arabidopsis lyrata subsp. lyrata]
MKEQVEIQASPSSLGLKSRETLYLTIRHEESGGKCAHLMKEPDESYQRDGEEGNNSLLNPDMLAADDDVVKTFLIFSIKLQGCGSSSHDSPPAAMEDSQPSPSSNLNDAGNSTKNIPFDLTLEILSKLPAKSLIRFQAVSKLWFSIIRSKDFTDSFLTRSKTRPRLLFTFKHFDSRKRFIFSAPEHDNNDKSSTVVARHDMTISDLVYYIRSRPVNGFVCCTRGDSIAVCNPTTRQIVKFPDVKSNGRDVYARLGYDPVQDQYKVLC